MTTEKHYALYDLPLNGFTSTVGESKEEVVENGADWWYEINYDSEVDDINDTYDEESGMTYEEYEQMKLDEVRKIDNEEYLRNCDFEIRKISKKQYEVLCSVDWYESRITTNDLEILCKEKLSEEEMGKNVGRFRSCNGIN